MCLVRELPNRQSKNGHIKKKWIHLKKDNKDVEKKKDKRTSIVEDFNIFSQQLIELDKNSIKIYKI